MQQINFAPSNPLINFLINPKYRIYRHLLLIFLLTIVASNGTMIMYLGYPASVYSIVAIESVILALLYVGLAYLNNYVLIPRLLLKNYYLRYVLSVLSILLIINLITLFVEYCAMKEYLQGAPGRYSLFYKDRIIVLEFIGNIFIVLICMTGSSFPVLLRYLIDSGRQMNELEQLSLNSNLERLKSRISPQFLSNTLYNAGNLAQKSPEQTSKILMKLSKLLRYQLYDSTRDKVLLDADITFLDNFLKLENAQHDYFSYEISKKGNFNLLIPPLLFIPFVEYYVNQIPENEAQPFIHLLFEVENNRLHFTCVYTGSGTLTDQNMDIGLMNVKRRLDLLYKKSYSLEIIADKTMNKVNLQLVLN